MPDLIDMAKQAFEKARLFGGGFAEDFGTQLGQTPEKLSHLQDRPAPLMPPQVDAAMKIMGLIPQVEQSVSSGLGRAGMPGGKEFGLNIPDSPLGEISIGPRESLGMIAGLAIPGGEFGETGSMASKLASKMGPGAQRLAAKSAERAAAKAAPEAERLVPKIADEMGKIVGNPEVKRPPMVSRMSRAEREAANAETRAKVRGPEPTKAQFDPTTDKAYYPEENPQFNPELPEDFNDIDPQALRDIGPLPGKKSKVPDTKYIDSLPTRDQELQAARAYEKRPPPSPAMPRAEDLPVENEGASAYGRKPRGQRPALPRGPYSEDWVWGDELGDYANGNPRDKARLEARYPGIKDEATKYYGGPGEARARALDAAPTEYPPDYVGGVVTPANFPTPEQWAESRNPKAPPPRTRGSAPPDLSASDAGWIGPGGKDLSIRPGGPRENIAPATPVGEHPLTQAKRDLAAAEYEGGYQNTDLVLDSDGNPILPEGVLAPDISDVQGLADVEGSKWLSRKGSRVQDSTSGEALTRLPSAKTTSNFEGPSQFEGEAIGPVQAGENLAQLAERRAEIGQRRTGSASNTGGEKVLYDERNLKRAQQILDEELDPTGPTGGDPQKHPYFRDYLDNMIYASQPQMDEFGDVIYKKRPDGSIKMKDDTYDADGVLVPGKIKEPEKPFTPLYQRVAEQERLLREGKQKFGWKVDQPAGLGPVPDTRVVGWQETPYGRAWLRREAIAQITGSGGSAYKNYSPAQLADRLVKNNALSRANAANYDNPLAVSTKQHKKPSKFNTDAFTDEGASTDVNDMGHTVRGSEGTAFETQGDLEAAGVRPNEDAFDRARRRSLDETSYAQEQNAEIQFASDEDQARFIQLAGDIATNEKFLKKMSERKNHDFFEFSEKRKDGTVKKYTWNADDMDRHARQATKRIDNMRAEQAKLAGASEYGPDAERMGAGDQPEWDVTDAKQAQRVPGRELPEGVTGTIEQGPRAGQTFTGQMPSTRMQTHERADPISGLDPVQEEQILRRAWENMTPDQRMAEFSNSERRKASKITARSGLIPEREPFIAGPGKEGTNWTDYSANPPGVVEGADPALRAEGRGQNNYKPEDTKAYFAKRMADLMEAIPAVQQGRTVGNTAQRNAWEEYMQNKLAEMMRQR